MTNEKKPYYPCRFFIRDEHLLGEDQYFGVDPILFNLSDTIKSSRSELLQFYLNQKRSDEICMIERFQSDSARIRDFHFYFKNTLLMFYDMQKNEEEIEFWKNQNRTDGDEFIKSLHGLKK